MLLLFFCLLVLLFGKLCLLLGSLLDVLDLFLHTEKFRSAEASPKCTAAVHWDRNRLQTKVALAGWNQQCEISRYEIYMYTMHGLGN